MILNLQNTNYYQSVELKIYLLPPTIVLFSHSRTMPDCLRVVHRHYFVTDEIRRYLLFYHGSVSPYFKQVLNEYCAVPAQLLHQVSPYRLIHLVNQLL